MTGQKPGFFSYANTDRCQSRCITCAGWQTPPNVKENELTTDDWKRILTQMHEWMGDYEFVFSGGEPFLRDDLLELTTFAKNLGDRVNVVTNALALQNKCEDVIKSDFSTIYISLNAVKNPQIHIASRGREDSFKITMNVIQTLNYLNKHKNPDKPKNIIISSIVMPSNFDEVEPLVEFAEKEGLGGVSFQLLDNGDAFARPEDMTEKEGIELNEKAIKTLDKIMELKDQGRLVLNGYPQLKAYKILLTNPNEVAASECKVGYNNFAIDPYGNVRICFCMGPIGSLKENTPQEIWEGAKAQEVREKINACTKKCRLLNCNFKE